MSKYQIENRLGKFIPKFREIDEGFEEIFSEAVNNGFMRVLGKSCTQASYHLLEKSFGLTKQQIPRAIDQFTSAIEEIFGLGAKLLEITIMEYLARNITTVLVFPLATDDFSFSEYVKRSKSYLARVPLPLFAS